MRCLFNKVSPCTAAVQKKIHKYYMHGSFFHHSLCHAFIHHLQLIFQLKKLNEIYIVSLTLCKILNHFKLIYYLKSRLNLNKHLSVMLDNVKETIYQCIPRLLLRLCHSNFKLISNNVSNFS